MRPMLVLALLPFATACHASWEGKGTKVEASGTGTSRSFAARDFTGVALKGSDDVDVRTGAAFSVTAEGDPAVLDQLDIRLDGKTLTVGRKSKAGMFWDKGGSAKIHVVLPRLTDATVAGSGTMLVDRVEGTFDGVVAGSGDLTLASVAAQEASLSIAGSGNITLAGRADKMDVSVAGSGDLKGQRFTAGSADISIAGSGSVRANVPGKADISILGSGDVELRGGAKCDVSKIGSGEAKCS
ncbi:head GIN domain-containing protein [Sphingomonas azotifigens]|uniref:head GIN domain-containing protein n=1 Tax=Sphingomonas azotifigens TaxID=330920 RepID=UPI0009FD3582|nr:head GIN domain-containing protein [Sphingomonas azotifigens]